MNDCANVTLAIGASPVMADWVDEVEEMVGHAKALLLNFGMLNDEVFLSMLKAGKEANRQGIPIIFDPVGVGATSYRIEKAKKLLNQIDVAIIRGNHSEVASLIGLNVKTNGVDSGRVSDEIELTAVKTSRLYQSVVVISGKTDVVSDGKRYCLIYNGHEWLPRITGTGCSSGSLIAAFSAVSSDDYEAAIAGISTMGICGQRIKKLHPDIAGLGSFKIKLMDEISSINGVVWQDEIDAYEVVINK